MPEKPGATVVIDRVHKTWTEGEWECGSINNRVQVDLGDGPMVVHDDWKAPDVKPIASAVAQTLHLLGYQVSLRDDRKDLVRQASQQRGSES